MIRAALRAARASFRHHRRVLASAFAAGLVMAAGQAPLSLPYLAFPALAAILWLAARAGGAGGAAWIGWAGGAGYFAAGMFWIVEPFFVDPVRHGWMAPFALVLLPSGLALFWAAALGLAARLASGWRRLLLAAVLLSLAETARAFVLTGFPWALVGYMWIGAPQMQLAAVIGPHGLTLATALAAALGAAWAGRPARWLVAPAAAAIAVAAAGAWGAARLAGPLPEPAPLTLRIVQPNAEQHLKWDRDLAETFFRRLLAHTVAAPEGPKPGLVIWPETAVQYLLTPDGGLTRTIAAAAGGAHVAFGIVREEEGRYYNSLVLAGPEGTIEEIYDKAHLTPFGEYLPFGEVLSRFGIHGLAASAGAGFAAGPGPRVIDAGPAPRALPLICYEAIFPQGLRTAERPGWLLQITNDAWFGEVSGPYQHFAQARMRAVEQGLPLARAANTGVSGVIGPRGEVLATIPLGAEGHLDAALPPALPPTPYARTGDWTAIAAMLALAAALTLRRRGNSH